MYMKEIKLYEKENQNRYTQVDDEVYEELNKWHWHYSAGYVERTIYISKIKGVTKTRHVKIHREILNITDVNICIDHIDGNPLNNQRNNLRIATRSQNMANRKKSKPGKYSKYLGVSKSRTTKSKKLYEYWIASCRKDNKIQQIVCKTEIEAALAYNEMALKYHGEFSTINKIEKGL